MRAGGIVSYNFSYNLQIINLIHKKYQQSTSAKKILEIYCTYLNQNQQKISIQFMIHKENTIGKL